MPPAIFPQASALYETDASTLCTLVVNERSLTSSELTMSFGSYDEEARAREKDARSGGKARAVQHSEAAGSRQQAAGSRQQAAGSKQQAAGSKQQSERIVASARPTYRRLPLGRDL